jgi:hypothetical protein
MGNHGSSFERQQPPSFVGGWATSAERCAASGHFVTDVEHLLAKRNGKRTCGLWRQAGEKLHIWGTPAVGDILPWATLRNMRGRSGGWPSSPGCWPSIAQVTSSPQIEGRLHPNLHSTAGAWSSSTCCRQVSLLSSASPNGGKGKQRPRGNQAGTIRRALRRRPAVRGAESVAARGGRNGGGSRGGK